VQTEEEALIGGFASFCEHKYNRESLEVAMKLSLRLLLIALLVFPAYPSSNASKESYKYIFSMVKPRENPANVHWDDEMQIDFELNRIAFGFTLRNKTDNPMMINWDQVAYVDPLGETHKVMHQGVRFIQRDQPMPPSMIPPGAKLTDVLVPTDYVSYESGRYGGWTAREMYPKPEQGVQFRGKTFSIFMPLTINDKVKNYNFVFSIDIGLEIKRK
jgi:hypothetical protein